MRTGNRGEWGEERERMRGCREKEWKHTLRARAHGRSELALHITGLKNKSYGVLTCGILYSSLGL